MHDDLVEAHLVSAQLALESGQLEAAQKSLERAGDLATKQKLPPLEIYAMRAALESSRDRDPQPWIKRALDYNPRYGAVYEQLAHFEIMRSCSTRRCRCGMAIVGNGRSTKQTQC